MRKLTQEFHSFTIDPPKTLRDEFAMAAMRALIVSDSFYEAAVTMAQRNDISIKDVICKEAYDYADAMLKARES